MGFIIPALAFIALAVGLYLYWHHRAPKFSQITEQDYLNINNGIYHPEFEKACAAMLKDVSAKVTTFFNEPHDYTHYKLSDLIQKCEVVDRLPNGAGAAIHRDPPTLQGVTTLQMTRWSMKDMLRFQHELLHRIVWDDPDLEKKCELFASNGYHWPVAFDQYGSH